MSNRTGPSQCRAERAQWPTERTRANIKLRGALADVEPSRPRLMANRARTGLCQAEWSWPMVCQAGLGRRWAEQAQADVEPSRLESMSNRTGPSQCRAERTKADIEPSEPNGQPSEPEPISSWEGPWLMSSLAGPGWWQTEREQAYVKPSGSWPMVCQAGLGRRWAELP